jgi:hypothetical protein
MKSRQTNAPAVAAAKAGYSGSPAGRGRQFSGGNCGARTDVVQDRRGPGPTWPRTDVAQDRRGPGPSPASLAMMFELPCRK